MRNGPNVEFSKEAEGNFNFHVDWRAGPEEIMKAVDDELRQYGLEVVVHENGTGDFYAFSILPIEPAKKG